MNVSSKNIIFSFLVLGIWFLCSEDVYAQTTDSVVYKLIGLSEYKGDTIFVFELPAVTKTMRFKSAASYRRYLERQSRLEYNVRKVYPYATKAAAEINEIERRLEGKDPKERKEIIKTEYDDLMKQFKEPLKKLTVTQGKILVRLIYRETGNSAFTHIKEYKGSVSAYFWQSLALMFGNNLKSRYDGEGYDYDIEQIVLKIKGE